jgi:trimeric autotransporter adhesin
MSQMNRIVSTGGIVMALCAAFAGCSSRTNVSATSSSPAQFTHLFITAQAVWFNTNKDATPDDAGWAKFQLKNPVTVDLVQQSNGTLGEIANDLRVAPGTYNSILLLPVDPSTPLTASAQALGATYNQEADFADAASSPPAQLIILNPEKGIVANGTVKVPVGTATKNGVGGLPLGTTNSASTLFGSPTTVTPNSTTNNTTNNNGTTNANGTTVGVTNTGTGTTNNNTTTVSFGVYFHGDRDLHLFNYPSSTASTRATGVLLSASPTANDLSTAGGITGTLTLTNITNVSSNESIANPFSGRTAIEASAELLSADGTHHVVVASAPVDSSGTFTIYPLQSNSRTPTVYDVVIHGPTIATIIIKNVSVATTTPTLTAAANTTGSVATTTASGAVSLGTLIPYTASSFAVNLNATAGATVPPGAALAFYQTLSGASEVPYTIDEVGIDPINRQLVTAESLGMGPIYTGIYSSNGGTITLTSSQPQEKAGVYDVGATAPLFTDSTPSTSSNNQVSKSSPTVNALPALQPGNSAGNASITATVIDSSHLYNYGKLLVSHNGALVGSADLSDVLAERATTATVNGLPTGNVYYLSVIVGNTSTPTSLKYASDPTAVNLASGGATPTVTID